MTQTPLRFGLIGSGRIGQVHAANIAADPDAVLARIADPLVDGAQRLARLYGGEATSEPDELFASGDLDAVLVASPTPTHVELIEACIDAGLPVLCEKPIDLDIARVDALRRRSSERDPRSAGLQPALRPQLRARAHAGAAGEIGKLEHLIDRQPGSGPPRLRTTSECRAGSSAT